MENKDDTDFPIMQLMIKEHYTTQKKKYEKHKMIKYI